MLTTRGRPSASDLPSSLSTSTYGNLRKLDTDDEEPVLGRDTMKRNSQALVNSLQQQPSVAGPSGYGVGGGAAARIGRKSAGDPRVDKENNQFQKAFSVNQPATTQHGLAPTSMSSARSYQPMQAPPGAGGSSALGSMGRCNGSSSAADGSQAEGWHLTDEMMHQPWGTVLRTLQKQ